MPRLQYIQKHLLGLLDRRATESVLGDGTFLALLNELGVTYKKSKSSITTADGSKNIVEEYVWLTDGFGNREQEIKLSIVPSLKAPVYLGIDFWIQFDLTPD